MDHIIPETWKSTLQRVQKILPHSAIAGGALRDLVLDREIKDVDIFSLVNDAWESFLEKEFKNNAFHISERTIYIDGKPEREEESGRRIFAIYNFTVDDTKFEVIVGDARACDISLFDIGICQISFDGKAVSTTEAFERGKRDRIIEMVNPRPPHRQQERLQRMKEKFPDFRVIEA